MAFKIVPDPADTLIRATIVQSMIYEMTENRSERGSIITEQRGIHLTKKGLTLHCRLQLNSQAMLVSVS
jgi:hypothetical protein